MKKWLILLIMGVVIFPVATATFCEDILEPYDACNMTTPVLACSTYNYSVYTEGGARVLNGTLTEINSSIYRYEISNLSEGSYIQLLCDGRTRELYVREGDSMSYLIAIGIMIVVFIWLLVKLAEGVKSDHPLLRFSFYIFAVILAFAGMSFGLTIAQQMTNNTAIANSLLNIYTAVLWVIRILFAYIFVYYGYWVLKWLNKVIKRRK